MFSSTIVEYYELQLKGSFYTYQAFDLDIQVCKNCKLHIQYMSVQYDCL